MEKNVRYKVSVDSDELVRYGIELDKVNDKIKEQISLVNSSATTAKQTQIEQSKQIAEIKANYTSLVESEKRLTLESKAQSQERISDAKAEQRERSNQSDIIKSKALSDEKIRTQQQSDESRIRVVKEKEEAQARLIELKKQAGAYDDLSGTVKNFAAIVVSAFSIREIAQWGLSVIDAKTKTDLFQQSLVDMIGNKQKADSINAELLRIAQKSPFEVEQLQETTMRLKAMGVETDKLVPYINSLGDISARVGTEKLPLIAKAMTDVQNKGTLMAQEIKQFTDNGVPLFDLLAKSMEKPREEVVKLAENHKIAFADVEKALLDATKTGGVYYNAMTTASKTLGGQVSNLADIYFIAKTRIGNVYEDTFQNAIDTTKELMNATIGSEGALTRTTEALKAGASAIATYTLATTGVSIAQTAFSAIQKAGLIIQGEYILATQAMTGSMNILTASETEAVVATQAFNASLRSNPIGLAITAIGGLVTAYYAYKAINTEVLELQSAEIDNAQKQVVNFNQLANKLSNVKEGTDDYKKTVLELQKQYPAYFSNLSTEKNNHDAITTAIALTNAELQKKIKLAMLNAKTDQLSEKAVEVEKQRYDIIQKLRKENEALSLKFSNDLQFVDELAKKAKASNEAFQEAGLLDPTAKQVISYKELSKVADNTMSEINKITKDSEKIRSDIYTSELNGLKSMLASKLEAHKGNLAEQKKDQEWYTQQVAILEGKSVESAKTADDEKVKNKNITAGKLRAIIGESELEEKKLSFATVDEIYKKKLDVLKAERDDRIKQAQQTYKDIKSETSAIIAIQDQYLKDRTVLNTEYEKVWKQLRQGELIQVKEIQRDVIRVTGDSLKMRIDQEKAKDKELAKINADYVKAYSDYLNVLNKRDDARSVYEQVLNAKTQSEKTAIIIKYGKKADDEILANTIARLKADEVAQTRHLTFLSLTYGKDSVQYKAYQVIAQKTTTDRVDAETKYFTKASADRLQLYEKERVQYQKILNDTLKMVSTTFDNMTKAVNEFANDSVSNLKKSYDAQYKLLGDNTTAKIELTKKYAQMEEDLLISNARFQRFTTFISNLTKEFQNYNEKRVQFEEQYQTKVAQINKNYTDGIITDMEKTNQLKVTGTENTLQKISAITQSALSLVSSYYQMEYNFKVQQLDAQLEYTRKITQDQIDLATKLKDEKLNALDEEEKAKLATLEKQKQAEIDAVNEAKNSGVITAEEASAKLEEIDKRYADATLAITQATTDEKAKINDQYTKDVNSLNEEQARREDEIERQKFEAQKEMMITQILLQALMAEAALLPYYAALVTLPYAIAAAVAIAVASGAMIAKVSSMQYKSPLGSSYSAVGWSGSGGYGNGGTAGGVNPNVPIGDVGSVSGSVYAKAPYGGKVADKSGTAGDDGHEMPIENIYDDKGNYIYSIYEWQGEWKYDDQGNIISMPTPRMTPNFFKGSNFVDLENRYPSGIDTVPAMVNKGERILPTSLNEAIGGASLSNEELVQNLQLFDAIKSAMPNLVRNFEMDMNFGDYDFGGSMGDSAKLDKLISTIENKKTVNVKIDGYAMTIDEVGNNYTARYIDKILNN